MRGNKHSWVTFYNPRNGKVRIIACAYCGTARSFVTSNTRCVSLPQSQHHMKKLGWEVLPKIA